MKTCPTSDLDFCRKRHLGSSISGPECGESTKFVGYRETSITTLMGSVRYSRAYYHCHQGQFFTDGGRGIEGKQTPGCREIVSLTGALEPFAEAAERLLVKLTGLNVSASVVRRVTEAVGNDVATRRAEGETLGPATP